eukprot:TRINITY_DN1908_c0_g1_i3.p2 TRINITY_DN1908_c0_g1~~TRINITY_DN1908_c0_g1_i3.p2  ORF type:complete len:190 (+),score=55.30 TRINITY_DN1908_c0_g1_i3:1263-1832(+)
MLSGRPPFYSTSTREVLELIVKGSVTFSGSFWAIGVEPVWKMMPSECVNLVRQMLTYDMKERITASKALRDPWLMSFQENSKVINKDSLVKVVKSWKNFRTQTKLQVAVLSYITSQHLPREEEARIRELFATFDKDQNGELTKEELMEVLKLMHGDVKKLKKEVNEIFRNLDLDNNGTIGYNGTCIELQ